MKTKTNWIELIWGGDPGLLSTLIGLAKVLASLLLALFVYQGLLFFAHEYLESRRSAYVKSVGEASQHLKDADISAQLCLTAPTDGTGCSKDLKLVPETTTTNWLAIAVIDKIGHPTNVTFVDDERVGFVSNPRIIHSVHSFSRIVERAHQAQPNGVDTTTNLKLCSGSLKALDDSTCTKIAQALRPLLNQIEGDLEWIRVICLMFGFIQYLVLSVFIFIVIETIGARIVLFSAQDVFFERDSASDLQLVTEKEFPEAVKRYNALRYRSPGDRLVARVLQTGLKRAETGNDNSPSDASSPVASAVVEAFREYEISEPDSVLTSLDVANEAMLKLAFVGTIWGIGSALFLVRDLDSLDPVGRIVTKSGMFAGIGTGFGTTMVGVLLSIAASLQIQAISRRWEELVNDYYRLIINTGVARISSFAGSLTVPPLPGPRPRLRPQPSLFVRFFRTAVFVGAAVTIWLLHSQIRDVFDRLIAPGSN